MDRKRISGPPGSDHGGGHRKAKAPPGLHVIERDGHFHLHGTFRAGGGSRRVRQSLGLAASRENREAAEALRRQVERDLSDELIHGKVSVAAVAFVIAADEYLNSEPDSPAAPAKAPKPRTREAIKRLVVSLGRRTLKDITPAEWEHAIARLLPGRAAATRIRFITSLTPFFKHCIARRYLTAVPEIEKPAAPPRDHHRVRRRVVDLTPELLTFAFGHAPIHLRAQLYTAWCTGARLSSILFGCRLCDLILAPGREQLTFVHTKTGHAVTAALHPVAAAVLRDYLEWRGQLHKREEPLFLSDRRKPYSRTAFENGSSAANKTAFRAMRWKAAKGLRRRAAEARVAGQHDEASELWSQAALLRQVTMHWLRHWFATNALASGMDPRSVMQQGGWRTLGTVVGYAHTVPEAQRRGVLGLPMGAVDTPKTRAVIATKNI
jgi:site-specific recombinase XerD